jgi:hypothetical protein
MHFHFRGRAAAMIGYGQAGTPVPTVTFDAIGIVCFLCPRTGLKKDGMRCAALRPEPMKYE